MPPKLNDSETMAFRIPLRVIREFRILSDKTERTIAWHMRKALAQYLEREKPTSTQTPQAPTPAATAPAPAPVVTAQSEAEMLKARIAELEAKLDLRAAVVRYDLPPSGRSAPKGAKQAAAVPPTSISKHSVKH